MRLLSTPTVKNRPGIRRLECPFHVLTSLTAEPPFRSHVQEPRRKRSIAKTVMLPPSVQTVNQGVVSQFEFFFLFLYGPRGPGFGVFASASPTIQSMSRTVSVSPDAIAGVILSVLCIRQKLYQTK